MIEIHPFGIFTPKNPKYFLLGSFTTKEANFDHTYDWFYGAQRNQFWPILRIIYGRPLGTKREKQELFTGISMAIGDIIFRCERQRGNNLDSNLINIIYYEAPIKTILGQNKISKIYFSSRFVELTFRKIFKDLIAGFLEAELLTLPSPSPRYAVMSLKEKVKRYKELLPKLRKD